ncbi:transposase zinc-binding domain-containing protein [Bacillus sp. IITD106]|nr:transposase zinc-binding domain-containing protein [Bacillus sp. IITD106]
MKNPIPPAYVIFIKEVEKFCDCGDPNNGLKLYVFERYHDVRHVPIRCKGRFCTTGLVGESEVWSRILSPCSQLFVTKAVYINYGLMNSSNIEGCIGIG